MPKKTTPQKTEKPEPLEQQYQSSSDYLQLVIERLGAELTLTQIEALIGDKVDIVLTEGYKQANTVKIEVAHFTDDVIGIADFLIGQINQNLVVGKVS